MIIISKARDKGKTSELIELCAKDEKGIFVCFDIHSKSISQHPSMHNYFGRIKTWNNQSISLDRKLLK